MYDLSTFFVRLRAWYQVVARVHVGPQIATRYIVIATRRLVAFYDCVSHLKGQRIKSYEFV